MLRQRIRQILSLLVLTYAFGLFLVNSQLAIFPSYFLWDHFLKSSLQSSDQPRPDLPIVLVSIDEDSYERLGIKWPWSREVFAEALNKLSLLHPKVIGIDLAFFGQSVQKQADEKLIAALGNIENVVLATSFAKGGLYRTPYQPILDKATMTGFVNLPISENGIIREATLLALDEEGEIISLSFGMALMMIYRGIKDSPTYQISREFWGSKYSVTLNLPSGEKTIWTDAGFNVGINFPVKPQQIVRIPFWKLMVDDPSAQIARDKIVIMGVESSIFKDTYETPFGANSGMSIHAINTLMLLTDNTVTNLSPIFPTLSFMLLSLIASIFLTVLKKWRGIFATLLLMVLGFWISDYFWKQKIFFDSSLTIIGLTFLILWAEIYKGGIPLLEVMQLKNQLAQDALTNAFAFRYFELSCCAMLKKFKKGDKISLIILDVDHFKEVNDSHGHQIGNEVLQFLVRVLKKNARRQGDMVARFGGDEFCVLLVGGSKETAKTYLDRVMKDITDTLPAGVPQFSISAGGLVITESKPENFKHFMSSVDKLLYEAKKAGRNQYKLL